MIEFGSKFVTAVAVSAPQWADAFQKVIEREVFGKSIRRVEFVFERVELYSPVSDLSLDPLVRNSNVADAPKSSARGNGPAGG